MSRVGTYLAQHPPKEQNSASIAFLAALDHLESQVPEVTRHIEKELQDQRSHLKLIASENYCSLATQLAMGNWLTDKYAEGFPFHRFYAGCENVDQVEAHAVDLAQRLFGADHAYVQPHSGADANMVAFWSVIVQRVQSREVEKLGKQTLEDLTPEELESVRRILMQQTLMGMSLNAGGHLTHGFRHNLSSKMMRAVSYDVDPTTEEVDYGAIAAQARKEKPLILLAGYSAYPRRIDFAKMREIADSVGAVLMVDMAHFAGLVAGKAFTGVHDPIPYAHIVTSTTHKTLRGPRGGLVLCSEEFRETIDKGCPLVLGGPLPHVIAAKAVALSEALKPEFGSYSKNILENAQALAEGFIEQGVRLTTGGTDNHLLIVDVSGFGLTGRQAETALRQAGLTVNRNAIPFDQNGAWYTSGIRLGTAATTTLGMGTAEMKEIARIITDVLTHVNPAIVERTGAASKAKYVLSQEVVNRSRQRVKELLGKFPLYPEIPLGPTEEKIPSHTSVS